MTEALFNTARIPLQNPDAVFREEFDDWAVLFNPDNAEAAGVNPVGAIVWGFIDGKRTIGEIIEVTKSSFEDAPETVAEDVTAFLTELESKGFIGYEL